MAVLFHSIGLLGILLGNRDFFVHSTTFNLLLMFALLLYCRPGANRSFVFFFITCFVVGIGVEWIGTKTGLLFGQYRYGTALGTAIDGVPLIIGINWFSVTYCCGVTVHMLMTKLANRMGEKGEPVQKGLAAIAMVVDAAALAVLLDWIMEPVAVKLGYWQWLGDGQIPMFNYLCWLLISLLLQVLFRFSAFDKHNKFAVHLLLIQALFFLLLRTFL